MVLSSGGYWPSRDEAKNMSTTFTDTQVNSCFSIYHTETKLLLYFRKYTY